MCESCFHFHFSPFNWINAFTMFFTMKKKILTLFAAAVVLMFATGARAQKLGFNVGYASEYFPAFTVPEHNQLNNPHLTGGFLNVTYTYNFSQYLGVTVGVGGRYNMRQYESTLLTFPASTKESQIVADVPVLLNLCIPLSDYSEVSLFGGPLVSFGITGKSTNTESLYGQSFEVPWYGEPAVYKRLNVQATVGIALEVHHIRLMGGYSKGFLNIDGREGKHLTSSGIYLGVGYCL